MAEGTRLRVISGLDWSGDAGDPIKVSGPSPFLVFAVVHLNAEKWEIMERALREARRKRSLPADYVFHFSGSRPKIREAFFNEIAGVPLSVHARIVNKQSWSRLYIQRTSGDMRIQEEIIQLLLACPDNVIASQSLLIDGSKRELRKNASIKTALNQAQSSRARSGFHRVRFCADDHPSQGAILQVADMVAGALHDMGEITGPYLTRLGSRITLV